MMERALKPDNWEGALRAVERNNGAPGPDGMKAKELRAHLALHEEVMKEALSNKTLLRYGFIMPSDLAR